jgi:hypothetical protein
MNFIDDGLVDFSLHFLDGDQIGPLYGSYSDEIAKEKVL